MLDNLLKCLELIKLFEANILADIFNYFLFTILWELC